MEVMSNDKQCVTPKQRVLQRYPNATCTWLTSFRFYAIHANAGVADGPLNDVLEGGSPRRAWADAARLLRKRAIVDRKLRYARKQLNQRTRKPR